MPYAIALLMIAASILMAPAVQAEKRVALVIGNSAYEQTVRLKIRTMMRLMFPRP